MQSVTGWQRKRSYTMAIHNESFANIL